jgi:hypothetical protein
MDDALQQLRDLHLPAEPALWPPAPGWWLLAALSIALGAYAVVQWRRARRRARPFRLAGDALDRLLADARAERLSDRDFADAVNALLKRALIHGARRHDAAPLTGTAWLAYLDGLSTGGAFSRGPGAALGEQRFAPDPRVDAAALHDLARSVLRRAERLAVP